ncbi:DUF1604-domain-containing protein [Phlegmacium glaucopus]|nr:DUF1604-domain-containing protein [Phlegmacium glaucopus]
MTTRLKRKLGELGVDTSSRKANENFCLIGTPLPPLEKSKDTGEFVPLWKQEVRDEKGRRRLHGAFTGGFSAGYFNTVGSKEGWTPSTFVSSRGDRAKKQAARPEDFMDDEDLQDIKDSRNLVDTTEEMDFLGGTQKELQGKDDVDESDKDPVTRALEASLLPAPKDSVGARILKKMGWRLGQGIGPRISLKQRKAEDTLAYQPTTGTRYTGHTLELPDDDEEASKHTYAPRDTPVLHVNRKDNSHGLGYVPGLSLNESLGGNSGVSQGPRLAGGFGLGALNDAEDDDLDVYDHSHQQSRRRLAYDHHDGDDDNVVVIGGKGDNKNIVQERSVSSVQYFRDGRPVTTGFVLSLEPVAEDRWFPLPDVPPEWKPNPKKLWASVDADKELKPPSGPEPHEKWKRSNLSADHRGAILGETPLPSAPRSIFEYMSEKDKQRIKRIASGLTAPPSEESILEDYAKAASLFKPISGAMASRFTSAAVVDFGPNVHEGLHTPSHEEIAAKEAQRRKEEEDKISPKAHAAKMGMFGPLTRETKPWQPASRLCKRFGVKVPELQPDMPSEASSSKVGPSFTQFEQTESVPASAEKDNTVPVQKPDRPRDLANIGLGEDETQGQDTLTYERPSMDIFKAIFASDDEDSDDEQEKEPEPDEQPDLPPLSTNGPSSVGIVTDDIPVDLSTFKPTFIPREGKSKKSERSKEKKEKKKEKREKKGVLVSFVMDEDGMEVAQPKQSKDRPKKKRKDRKEGEGDDDVGMWADKPPPEVTSTTLNTSTTDTSAAPKGRKRAIDFM